MEGLITDPPTRLFITIEFSANPLTPGRDVLGGSFLTNLNAGAWVYIVDSC